MKNDSIYQNYPQKHLILDIHNKNIPKVLREKSSSLYPSPVNCEASSINTEVLVPNTFYYFYQNHVANRKQFIQFPCQTRSAHNHCTNHVWKRENREETIVFASCIWDHYYLLEWCRRKTMLQVYCIPDQISKITQKAVLYLL